MTGVDGRGEAIGFPEGAVEARERCGVDDVTGVDGDVTCCCAGDPPLASDCVCACFSFAFSSFSCAHFSLNMFRKVDKIHVCHCVCFKISKARSKKGFKNYRLALFLSTNTQTDIYTRYTLPKHTHAHRE